jgi:hypothetical protein
MAWDVEFDDSFEVVWTAPPRRHQSAKAWAPEAPQEGEAMGRAAGVWHHRRWMKLMVVPHAPLLVASFSAF